MLLLGRSTAAAGLVLACLLFPGCLVGPDFARPAVDTPEAWRQFEDSDLFPVSDDLAEWWKSFNDPLLDVLVDQALAENLDLREACFRILEARCLRGVVRADLGPQFDGDASYTFTKIATSGNAFGFDASQFGIDPTLDFYSMGINGSWEIDVFGRLRRLVEAADADIRFSVWDYRDVRVILLADVAANYIEARRFQRLVQIAQDNLRTQRESLELTQKRFRAGVISELDVAQARANVQSTEAEIPTLLSGYQASVNRLSVLLAVPVGTLDTFLDQVAPIPTAPQGIAVGIPADLLRRRPDIRRAEAAIAGQSARIGAAMGDFYPQFSIVGTFGVDAQKLSRLYTEAGFNSAVGPSIRWDFFNFGRIRANVCVQEARLYQRTVAYRRTVLQAGEEVDNSIVAYVQELDRRDALQGAVAANRRAVEISQKQYEQGAVSFQRVLDSQRAQLLTEAELATSEATVVQNVVQLYRALGGGWTAPTGVQPLPPVTQDGLPGEAIDAPPPAPSELGGEAPPLERLPAVPAP